MWRGGLPPLGCAATPGFYDCCAAERGDAAIRQGPSPQVRRYGFVDTPPVPAATACRWPGARPAGWSRCWCTSA
ncbi:hypothetical protein DJ564_30230 [Pseudomonas sp. 31-12]|nr:hypothetical protein DJ564_30230 [Pseudomonas sp. 31-12]